MLDESFDVLVLMPSMAFAYSVLYTFYGARRAYEAICWVPATIWLTIAAFIPLREFAPAQGLAFEPLLRAVESTSLIQALMGLVLIALAIHRREKFFLLFIATVVTGIPFILRLLSR